MAKEKKYAKGSFYQIEGDKLQRTKRACPKCGAGVFMAEHKNRHSCGKCSFTEMKSGGS